MFYDVIKNRLGNKLTSPICPLIGRIWTHLTVECGHETANRAVPALASSRPMNLVLDYVVQHKCSKSFAVITVLFNFE